MGLAARRRMLAAFQGRRELGDGLCPLRRSLDSVGFKRISIQFMGAQEPLWSMNGGVLPSDKRGLDGKMWRQGQKANRIRAPDHLRGQP
jgi:hypothetical protein